MAGRKYSDIYKVSNTTSIANTDLLIVERADGNTYAFQANTLYKNVGVGLAGPYANDSAAAVGGVQLKNLYYDSTGVVKIRLN
jgi:hypothetical protein